MVPPWPSRTSLSSGHYSPTSLNTATAALCFLVQISGESDWFNLAYDLGPLESDDLLYPISCGLATGSWNGEGGLGWVM